MQVRRRGYAAGAEITGLDLAKPLDGAAIAAIRKTWLEHVVVSFPGQDLGPAELTAFCGRFGELDDYRNRPHVRRPDFPCVSLIANQPTTINGTAVPSVKADEWHTDLSFSQRPGTANFLYANELPDVGGDTMFANMYLAYDALSDRLKELLTTLEGVHDVTLAPNFSSHSPELQEERRRNHPPVVHPIVRVHPETGRKALFCGSFLRKFRGMTDEESRPLIDFLNEHATRYEFTYRHRWCPGDLVMWDNRCALHYAVQDYDQSQLRRMQRCVLFPPRSGSVCEEETHLIPAVN